MHPRKLRLLVLSSKGAGILELRWFAPLFRGAGISGLHLLPPLPRRAGVSESRGGGLRAQLKAKLCSARERIQPRGGAVKLYGEIRNGTGGGKRVTGGRGVSRRWCKDTGWWWGEQIRAIGGAGYTRATGRRQWGAFFRILIRGWCFVSGNMPMFAKAHESNMSLAFGFEKWHRLCGGYRRMALSRLGPSWLISPFFFRLYLFETNKR